VVEPLLRAFSSDSVWELEAEAAALIGDSRLYPALTALETEWKGNKESLEDAMRACSPSAAERKRPNCEAISPVAE
jgi:hypothetical protein